MSEHIDALVLIGLSSRIVADVPHYAHEDAEQGLSYIYEGRKRWYDGKPITEADKINLHASEVFLKLGRLTADIYLNKPISFIKNENSFKFPAIETIQNLSPLAEGETLNLPVEINYWSSSLAGNGLPEMFGAALTQEPSILPELLSKWAIARQIHANRGSIRLPGYNIDELIHGIDGLNIDEIAPTDITGSSYTSADLINHAGVEVHPIDFPYYSTYNERRNATKMLESALEDLTLLSETIR